jgi:mannose-6-phosphate isomerase-like protein (cupin superfamily)
MTEARPGRGGVIPLDELPHTVDAHDFVGEEYDSVPFSLILVHTRPGGGPRLHRHPYPEVFIVESGQATFRLGDKEIVVPEGHVVVGPSNVPHGFTNTGTGELHLVAIHGASRFATEWLAGADPVWTSRPRP